jgi:HSF-type DNA-binding
MDECHVSWTKEVEEEDPHRMVTVASSSISVSAVTVNGSDSTSSCGASSTMPSSPEAVSPLHQPTRPPTTARSASATTVSFHGLSALIEAATSQLEHLAEVASSQLHDNDDYNNDDDTDAAAAAPLDDEEDDVDDDNLNDATTTGEFHERRKDTTKKDAELSQADFPKRLLLLCLDPNNSDTITFLPDGKFFAIRQSNFATFLARYFEGLSSFDDFVQLTERWGFSRIGSTNSTLASSSTSRSEADATHSPSTSTVSSQGIVVFRHPNFLASDAERCRLIRYGDCPEKVRMYALPSHNRINVGGLSDLANNVVQQPKRRLSPGFLNRQEIPPSTATTRQRVNDDNGEDGSGGDEAANHAQSRRHERSVSLGEENDLATPELVAIAPKPRQRHSLPVPLAPTSLSQVTRNDPSPISISDYYSNDHARSMALSITSEHLKLTTHKRKPGKTNSSPVTSSTAPTTTLAETAVTSCTHDIVTDAIESLLRDARHSKEMYLKHEKELSKSSLPGVVPVCKHIFAPTMKESKSKTVATSPSDTDTKSVQILARVVTQDESKSSVTAAVRQDEPRTTDSASQDQSTCRESGHTVLPHRTRSGLLRSLSRGSSEAL